MTARTLTRLTACLIVSTAVFGAAPYGGREPAPRGAADEPADTVLVNGKILTVDARDSVAEAIAITDGRIVLVGSNAAVNGRIGERTRVIDLHGRTATPGLIDAHCHFDQADLLYQIDVGYPSVKRIDEVLGKVREQVATLKPGEWVRGVGWDEGKLEERRYIYAADLDRVSPDNPVYLRHTTGHYAATNSYALKLAGVTRDTQDPPAGTIDRLPDGRPSGVLKESATGLVSGLVPPYSRDQRKNGLLKIAGAFGKEGMTAVKDPGIDATDWELYQELLKEDNLTVRVFALWRAGRTLEGARELMKRVGSFTQHSGWRSDRLISGGMKLFMDGSGGARTAWVYDEWNRNFTDKDPGNHGYPAMDPQIYRQIVALFHNAGIHVSTHAIGDRAIDSVVDTYAAVLEQKPVRGLRHGIIHANIPTDRAINVMAELQRKYDAGYPEASSTFTWWIGDTYAGNFGEDRSRRLMPFKTYLDKGVLWAGGSDYSVTPFPARYGIWASIARRPVQGTYGPTPFGSAEAIGVRPALRSYTIWAARQIFLEDKIGSIEPGKMADIAIWDRSFYDVPPEEIQNLKCEMTLFGGRIVHQAEGSPITVRKK